MFSKTSLFEQYHAVLSINSVKKVKLHTSMDQ